MQRGRRRGFEVDQPMDKEHRASNLIPSPVPKKKKKIGLNIPGKEGTETIGNGAGHNL